MLNDFIRKAASASAWAMLKTQTFQGAHSELYYSRKTRESRYREQLECGLFLQKCFYKKWRGFIQNFIIIFGI